jgi:nitrogen fixation NifU-like protein
MACGLDLEAAENLTEDAVIRALGGLPEAKKHCSMLSIGALQVALADYRRRQEMLTAGLIESKEEYRRRRDELNRPASSTGDEGE